MSDVLWGWTGDEEGTDIGTLVDEDGREKTDIGGFTRHAWHKLLGWQVENCCKCPDVRGGCSLPVGEYVKPQHEQAYRVGPEISIDFHLPDVDGDYHIADCPDDYGFNWFPNCHTNRPCIAKSAGVECDLPSVYSCPTRWYSGKGPDSPWFSGSPCCPPGQLSGFIDFPLDPRGPEYITAPSISITYETCPEGPGYERDDGFTPYYWPEFASEYRSYVSGLRFSARMTCDAIIVSAVLFRGPGFLRGPSCCARESGSPHSPRQPDSARLEGDWWPNIGTYPFGPRARGRHRRRRPGGFGAGLRVP